MNFLVIDIGTSGGRAATVGGNGKILSQSRCPVKIDHPRPFLAEIDTDRLWRAVQKLVKSEIKRHSGIAIDAIGVSAMLAYVFLDRAGRPLMPAVTYADNRATAELIEIRQRFPEEKFFAKTGRMPSQLLLAPKLKWLANHRPDVAGKLGHIIGLKDDIIRRLSGEIQTDVAHLDYSGLYNVYRGELEPEILDALDIKPSVFAAPTPATAIAGTVSAATAKQLNLTCGTPVISGSSDGTTAMYGAGVLNDKNAVLVSGTTDVLMMSCPSAPRNPSHALSINSGMQPGTYLIGGPLGLSGGTLQYFEQLLQTSITRLEKKIAGLPPGSDGLLIFPGLSGERSPYWKEYFTGAIIGLTPLHQSEHLLRAAMEGCALRILKLLNIFSLNRLLPRALNIVGGGANLDVWNQIRADVSGLMVQKLSISEATSLGTALFCRAALDKTQTLTQVSDQWIKIAKIFRPDPKRTQLYNKLAPLFDDFIETNAFVFEALDKFKRQPEI